MYRLTSANHLRTLFTAAAAPYPRRLLHLNPSLRSFACTYSSRRCVAEPPPPPATDEFVKVGEKSNIRGGDSENLHGNAYKRKVLLPELLSENIAMLTCESSAAGGICNVYLVGTIHDSLKSRREVKAVIQFLKPELDIDRKIIKKMRVRFGAESEFGEAYYQAMQYGAKVILGDRPIEITMKRMMANIFNWDLIKSVYDTMFQKSLAGHWEMAILPAFDESIVHERDQYMSAKLLEVAHEHNSVVAVVGKAHLPGIQKNWKQPVELERLLSLPSETNSFTIHSLF